MATDGSLLDVSEHPERSAESFLPHGTDGALFDWLALGLLLAAVFFLLFERNIALSGLLFLAFLFAFHPVHAQFRLRKRLGPI